jgi:hypothetical protein
MASQNAEQPRQLTLTLISTLGQSFISTLINMQLVFSCFQLLAMGRPQ